MAWLIPAVRVDHVAGEVDAVSQRGDASNEQQRHALREQLEAECDRAGSIADAPLIEPCEVHQLVHRADGDLGMHRGVKQKLLVSYSGRVPSK